jgi:hypothetical protein
MNTASKITNVETIDRLHTRLTEDRIEKGTVVS